MTIIPPLFHRIMSQDKRKLFGSRISSIFSSNDGHHHLKPSERNLSQNGSLTRGLIASSEPVKSRSTSHLQQSKTKDNKDSLDPDYVKPKRVLPHLPRESNQTTKSLSSQFSQTSINRDVPEIFSKKTHISPQTKLTRKPPPDSSETKEKSSDHFSDVIGSLGREIDNMAVEYRNKLPASRPSLSNLDSSEKIFPLKITRASEDQEPKIDSASFSLSQKYSVSGPTISKNKLVGPQDLYDTLSSSTEFFSDPIRGQKSFLSESESMPQVMRVTKDINNETNHQLQFENLGIHKDFSSGASSLERSLSSPEYNIESTSRRDFMFQDHEVHNGHLTETSTFPQSNRFHGSDSENFESRTSLKENTSSDSNDSIQRGGFSYPQNESAKSPYQQSVSDLNSSNGTGSGFLSNWDEIVDSAGGSIPGELDETNRLYKHISPVFTPNTGLIPDSVQPLQALSQQNRTHTRMLSMSSVYSTGSTRHVSLATLKMTFNLRPGEGEKSNYVDTLRKGAGTSFNEAGPGKWKLPTGIMPVDKRDLIMQNTKKFTRGVSSTGYRTKKSSGVELKHGHLQPRLLAAEVDEGEGTNKFGALGRSSTLQNKTITPITSKSSTPPAGLKGISRVNSLERANTLASISTAGDLHSSASKTSNSRRGSTISSTDSVGSISNDRNVDIYYQHQGFKFENGDNSLDDYSSRDRENLSQESEYSDDEKPRLFLANPDSDSD